MCPITEIFGFSLSTYAILVIVGFVLGIIAAILRRKINSVRTDELIACVLIAGVGALFGAKLFYMAQGFPEFLVRAEQTGYTFLQYFNDAGLVYYGGLIGGILFLFLSAKIIKAPVWGLIDTVLPTIPLMHALGRIGCLMAGCCYGIPSPLGFYFNASPFAPHNVQLLPIQLIEAVCLFALCAFMLWYSRKKRTPGRVLSCYLIGYGIIRFILEFFRYDAYRGIYGAFSVSQWVSLIMIALGFFFVFLYPRIKMRETL
ncbi:MAG: prolipoprotein diacylglyceryl transferase [Christensenella sp.]